MQNKTNVTKHNKIPYVTPETKILQFSAEDIVTLSGGSTTPPTEADTTLFVQWGSWD